MDVSDKAGTLRAQEHGHQPIICFKERAGKAGGGGKGILIGYDKTFTLSTLQQDTVCYSVENHPNDSRVKIRDDGTVQTLSARCGTGGATPHAHSLCYGIGRDAFNQGKNAKYNMQIDENLMPTVIARGPGGVCMLSPMKGNHAAQTPPQHTRSVQDE